jgi:hypothetical protein
MAIAMNADKWQNKIGKKEMTKAEIKKAQQKLEKWRKSHEDTNALRKAYRESIPEQVRASMAFEGEHVSLKMLKEYLMEMRRGKNT